MGYSETKQLKARQQDSELVSIQSTSQESHDTKMDCKIPFEKLVLGLHLFIFWILFTVTL